jgi:tricorn protease
MKNQFFTLIAILCLTATINAQDDLLIRHPAVSPDGQSLAFSWQGDIWTANIDGKDARRITPNVVNRWSNDCL